MSDHGIVKALGVSGDSAFEMVDVSPLVQRTQIAPKLLTALFGGEINSIFNQTRTVRHDDLQHEGVSVAGKQYSEYGPRALTDKPRQLSYDIGSFGVTYNTKPGDISGRRTPGTNELMTEEYLLGQLGNKVDKAWVKFEEQLIATLLTTDSNFTAGGNHTTYDYFVEVMGDTRANLIAGANGSGQVSMQLAGSVDHIELFTEQADYLQTDLEKTGNDSSMTVVICGKNFFAQRLEIERDVGFNRELRNTLDMQSMGVPAGGFGSGQFNYQWFDSPRDGIRYIRYAASYDGAKMIGDDDAYMVPIGAENFLRTAYAPAQTRTYVNTVAQSAYAWSKVDDRQGTTVASEKNVLGIAVNPQLIRRLVV